MPPVPPRFLRLCACKMEIEFIASTCMEYTNSILTKEKTSKFTTRSTMHSMWEDPPHISNVLCRIHSYTVKAFGLLQPLFQLPQLHVCVVCIMKFKECFQSSEDLEIKTLRSIFFNNQSSFQKTNQLPFVEKAWLHSYGRHCQ